MYISNRLSLSSTGDVSFSDIPSDKCIPEGFPLIINLCRFVLYIKQTSNKDPYLVKLFHTSQNIGSADIGSTRHLPPGSLHTLCAGGRIWQRIWLLYKLKLFVYDIFCEEYLQPSLCCKYAKKTDYYVPLNNSEFLSIHARSFDMFWNKGCTQSLAVSYKQCVVPILSTRASDFSQVIILCAETVVFQQNTMAADASGRYFNKDMLSSSIKVSMMNIRRSHYRPIFIMEIPYLERRFL